MRYRCGGRHCKQKFFWINEVQFAKCRDCNYVTARCEECGGLEGATRSVRSHVVWYMTLGIKRFGIEGFHQTLAKTPSKLKGKFRRAT